MNKKITKRKNDYNQWYLDVITTADLAEHSPTRGCMVIKPYGYAIWENIQKILNIKIKEIGAKNAYFPLLIPENLLKKEINHIKGFAPEYLTVTRIGNKKLDEPLILRPTSETIIYEMFSKWIKSYRDLPLIINQWANIIRWELRPRLFLRTTEFLWQEGHTVHSTEKEAREKTEQALKMYKSFVEDYLAIPVFVGKKTETQKFPGAIDTLCIEAMMQDKKAIQMGTSHILGQKFSQAFNIRFRGKDEKMHYPWQACWGITTRLIGATIMAHSDDKGLVLPPKIAPIQVIIIPIWTNKKEKNKIIKKSDFIAQKLQDKHQIRAEVDKREHISIGSKIFEWEKKGIPIRIEIGPKDIAKNSVIIAQRNKDKKQTITEKNISAYIIKSLEEMQKYLFSKASIFKKNNTYIVNEWKDFKSIINEQKGFSLSFWCGSLKCEQEIKIKTKAVISCIPLKQKQIQGKCIFCKKSSNKQVIFAKTY